MVPRNISQSSLVLYLLLGAVGVLHFLTMPQFFYPGDNLAIKAEAAHLVNTGRLGFDFSEKDLLGELGEEKGQYFFANDSRKVFYSKYAFLYTFSYLPPVFLKKHLTRDLQVYDNSDEMIFIFNCYTILWVLLYIIFLYKIFFYFNRNRWQSVLLVFLAIYPSYVWYYLRSPDKEIVQMVTFSGAIYYILLFSDSSKQGTPSWRHLAVALFWGGCTYFLKPLYALLLVGMGIFSAWELYCCGRSKRDSWTALKPYFYKSVVALLVMMLVIALLSFFHNYFRTGVFYDAGYGRDETIPVEFIFTASHFLKGLATYFVLPGNGNWFLHHPLLLVALFGYPTFFRKYRAVSIFLAMLVALHLIPLCFHEEWIGEWCYGPRFCLHLIMLCSIPAAASLAKLFSRLRERRGMLTNGVALALFSMIFLVSLRAQLHVQRWHYFTFYYYFQPFDSPELGKAYDYFKKMPHRALLNRDLELFQESGRKFPLLAHVDSLDLPDSEKEAVYTFTQRAIEQYDLNYMLLRGEPMGWRVWGEPSSGEMTTK